MTRMLLTRPHARLCKISFARHKALCSVACYAGGTHVNMRQDVAVIGAGAAGLVAARELRREGLRVTVFEQSKEIGGVWVYTNEIEDDDLLGQSHDRRTVHSSMYESLRTNLPRHVMGFTDFPFGFDTTGSDDKRLYCGHAEVLRYLQLFDTAFSISELVRFSTRVTQAVPVEAHSENSSASCSESPRLEDIRWRLSTLPEGPDRTFDALVVCNGHYSDPRVPELPGSDGFPGQLLHTHNFREARPFKGLAVVVMGASASGQDIAREIAGVADKVYFSARPMRFGSKIMDWEPSDTPYGPQNNIFKRLPVSELGSDGSVTFSDGSRASQVDAVVFATGYNFSFPFLDASGIISVSDNRVDPLYQHTICSSHPSLSFIGLPWQVIPFPLMELQAKWVARVISGRCRLPSRANMDAHTRAFAEERSAAGVPGRYFHRLGEEQWAFNAWLAEQIGPREPQLPGWRAEMHKAGQINIRERPDAYRDTWRDAATLESGEAAARQAGNQAAVA